MVLEKEDAPARHQSGRNSGVIHAGVYYTPGSVKARLCRQGLVETKAFCTKHDVEWSECGKLIVATNAQEQARLDALYVRGRENGVPLRQVSAGELREQEPHVRGLGAILSPETGIADYPGMAKAMIQRISSLGGEVRFNRPVIAIREEADVVGIETPDETIKAAQIVACGGLQADRLARMAGLRPDFHIVPFRGEYFQLAPEHSDIVKSLIYPAPDPMLPFLGVHLTLMIDGSVTVGPNARVAFAREGYGKFSVNLRDAADFVGFPGFWRFVGKHTGAAMHEMRISLMKAAYLREVQKYCPELTISDLKPYRAGHRAQAVDAKGQAIDDFHFLETARMLHVCNAPSPAATSSLPIGAFVAAKITSAAEGL